RVFRSRTSGFSRPIRGSTKSTWARCQQVWRERDWKTWRSRRVARHRTRSLLFSSKWTGRPGGQRRDAFSRCGLCLLVAARSLVLLLEPVNAARGVHQLLAAGEERMAGGTDLHADIALVRRAGLESVAAGANDVDFLISGVNTSLHCVGGNPFETPSVPKTR